MDMGTALKLPPAKTSSRSLRDRKGRFFWQPLIIVVSVHVVAVFAPFYFSFSNLYGFLIAHLLVGGVGASLGLHRYFSHRVFTCSPFVAGVLGVLASLNLQNGPITWAMYHRAHHRFTNRRGDPHSAAMGFFWSHFSWLFFVAPNGFRKNSVSVRDLSASRFLRFIDRHQLLLNGSIAGIFAVLTQDLGLFLWVFPLRLVVIWHSVWLINSYAHSARFSQSRHTLKIKNDPTLSVLMYGEGWHANHHLSPGEAYMGSKWYEIDWAYGILWVLHHLHIIRLKSRHAL